MNRKHLKNNAKEILRRDYWKILLPIVLVSILCLEFISFEVEYNGYGNVKNSYISLFNFQIPIDLSPFLLAIVIIAFVAGIIYSILFSDVLKYGLVNKLKHIALDDGDEYDLFEGFRSHYKEIVLLQLMAGIRILLFMFLFIVPGIIKAYEYRYICEIYDDHPDWHWKEVLNESKRLTQGHKWELFVLDLSFFLWTFLFSLLDAFSFGLASYLLDPYTRMTDVQAYLWLKEIDENQEPEMLHNENMFISY